MFWKVLFATPLTQNLEPVIGLTNKLKIMKKISIILSLMAFVGCQISEIDSSVNENVIETEMTNYQVGMDSDADTKTYHTDDYQIFWSEGDQMNIFAGINNDRADKLILVDGAGSKNGTFYGPYFAASGMDETLFHQTVIVYPYDAANTCVANSTKTEYTIGLTIPAVQKYTPGTFANGSHPMIGVTETPKELVVNTSNVNAALLIPIKGDVAVSKIVISSDEPLAGPATVTAAYGRVPVAKVNEATASKTVELVCEGGVQLNNDTATEFHISFAPCSGPVTVTIYATDGTYWKNAFQPKDDAGNPKGFERNDYISTSVIEYTPTGDMKKELADAFKNGKDFTLQTDLTITDALTLDSKTMTVDLNGYTLTSTAAPDRTNACFKLLNSNITFKNGKIVTTKKGYAFSMSGFSKGNLRLTMVDVDIVKKSGNGAVIYYSDGINAELTNVTVDAKSNVFFTNTGKQGNITIDGGQYKAAKSIFAIPAAMSVTFENSPKFSDTSYAAVKWNETGDAVYPYTPGGVIGATVNGESFVNVQDAINKAIETAAGAPAEVKLAANIELDEPIVIGNTATVETKSGASSVDVTINLNGKTITAANGDAIVVTNGAHLTITGKGTVKVLEGANGCAVWAHHGGKVTIENGTFSTNDDATGDRCDCIYAGSTADMSAGTVIINGGTFKYDGANPAGHKFLLNKKDKTASTITVNGGTFHKFNPAISYGEPNAPVDFVAEGSIVVETAAGVYEVLPSVANVVTLSKDVAVNSPIEITKGNVTLNLNGKTITSANGDAIVVSNDANLTITGNGVVKVLEGANGCAVWAHHGGKVTIENGTFSTNDDATGDRCDCIYAGSTADMSAGTVIINGGTFKYDGANPAGHKFLLNKKDKTASTITVNGGTFHKFNPAISYGEPNAPVDFVAEGYISVEISEDVWTVVSKSTPVEISTVDALLDVAAQGGIAVLANDIVLDDYVEVYNDMTVRLNGKKIVHPATSSAAYKDVFETFGEVKLTIEGEGEVIAEDGYCVYAAGNSTVTLNGGNYYSNVTAVDARKNAVVTINGGTFKVDLPNPDGDFGQKYTLNLRDKKGSYANELAAIIVKGGNFYKFNPAESESEPTITNFVADGYISVELTEGIWTVVPKSTPVEIASVDALLDVAAQGGIAVLANDIVLDDYVEVYNDMTVRLNGKKIVHPATSSAAYKDVFETFGEVKLTIEGEGEVIAEDGYCVYAAGNSTVTLNGGNYYSNVTAVDARKNAVVTINGGTFKVDLPNPDGDFGQKYTLNLRDKKGSYANELAAIIVKGGNFYKFNPAESESEPTITNFVADGYKSVADGDWFVVCKN